MKTYNLKSVAKRGGLLAAAFALVAATFVPVASTYADALNPLTDRSLTLSSSAPGWDFKDGSGNTTYADPNSGANGQKTGNTFNFKVSTDSSASGTNVPVKAFTFQYCTHAAGTCTAPGDNGTVAGVRNPDSVSAQTSDLNIASSSPTEVDNTGDAFFDSTNGVVTAIPNKDGTQGNYLVMTKDQGASTWSPSTGWTMTVTKNEDGQTVAGDSPDEGPTGKNNFITLTNSTTGMALKAGGQVQVIFFGTTNNYITNPGSGAFFVKINDYNSTTTMDDTTLVDGGVTVANVMNLGISIQTKVLETMDFSVGTVDPYTLSSTGGASSQLGIASNGKILTHGTCDPILTSMDPVNDKANVLMMGNETNENSLETNHTYSTHSYFRLSSNASAGATVYYSGVTLSNTVGDQIKPIGKNKVVASRGTEQFGLALANNSGVTASPDATYQVNYATERAADANYESGADDAASGLVALNNVATAGTAGTGTGVDASVQTDWTAGALVGKMPMLKVNADGTALAPTDNYNQGAGVVNTGVGYTGDPAMFAFDDTSNKIPVAIATESSKVVDCASAKVRYIANIAATTPAGIYTTKINYIAAPQY